MPRALTGLGVAALLLSGAAASDAGPRDGETSPVAAQPGAGEDLLATVELRREVLVTAVLARNPHGRAAQLAWTAATARLDAARSLPDPRLAYALAPLSAVDGEVRLGQRLEASQLFPGRARRAARGEVQSRRSSAMEGAYEGVRRQLALAAVQLFDDYAATAQELEIIADHRRLLVDARRVATARYAAGLAPQQDPLQAEVELAELERRQVALEIRQEVAAAALNELLHRPPAAPLPPPRPLEPPTDDRPTGATAELPELLEAAARRRPELAAARAAVGEAEAALTLAKLERRPGWRAMATYNSLWNEPDYRWTVGVAVDLPLRKKRLAADVAAAEAELEAARSRLVATGDQVAAEVAQSRALLAGTERILDLYDAHLLPAARDQVQAARSGFETAQNGFLAVIEAEKNLRTAELGHVEALADADRTLAELVARLGGVPGLDRLPTLLTAPPQEPAATAPSPDAPSADAPGDLP